MNIFEIENLIKKIENEDIQFDAVIDLKLSVTQNGRVLAKSVYQNKFKKTYEHYGDFLKEWEEAK